MEPLREAGAVVVAGARQAALGGNIEYRGAEVASAATMDLAALSYIYGASLGFFQGAALAQAEGLDVGAYGRIAGPCRRRSGRSCGTRGTWCSRGISPFRKVRCQFRWRRRNASSRVKGNKGLNVEAPAVMAKLLRQARAAGYAQQEFAAMVTVLRGQPGELTAAQVR